MGATVQMSWTQIERRPFARNGVEAETLSAYPLVKIYVEYEDDGLSMAVCQNKLWLEEPKLELLAPRITPNSHETASD